jgi:UDP-N-acetylmuramyl pentapeptide phosphotransferase/UDP-N-acetylglucosamine-1-phosphate transferase
VNPIVAISALVCSLFCLLFIQKYFITKNKIAIINKRSSHNTIATNSGGISIFITLFAISSVLYISGIELFDYKIFVPISLMTIIGLYDDLYIVDFKLKFLFQIIAAKIIIDQGFIITNLHGILGIFELSSIIAQLLTIFIIIAIINAINFIDGIDGLALAVFYIFIVSYEFFAKISYYAFDSLSITLIAITIPLWFFNYRKNKKIFLGDSGSLMLGTIISIYTVSILTNNYIIRPEFDVNKILFVISILLYPVIDIIRVFFLRIIKGKSPFIADKKHIHHILLNKVKSHGIVVLVISATTLIFIFLMQTLIN